MTEFASPASSEGIKYAEILGSLLLIEVDSIETGINTAFGEADAVRADVFVLDGDNGGQEYLDTLIFPLVLQSQLRSRVGQKVLGRLTQGQAKPGQSPPWKLTEATPEDLTLARQWLSQRDAPQPPAPAQSDDIPF